MERQSAVQLAALAFKVEDGHPMVMLVTSRETRRWILPKGQPEKKRPGWKVAAQEAYEEAGLLGHVSTKPVGSFAAIKRLPGGGELPCQVKVYLFEVETVLDEWPERHERERRWVTPGEAALMVAEAGLVEILLAFGALWIRQGGG